MQNALIFSPDLDGHRQVYVFVTAHILQEMGFKIIIAANFDQKTINSFYIKILKEKPDVTILNTNNYADGGLGINLSELLLLQNKYKADLTVFPEADNHISLFISQIYIKKNKLRGRIVGIFMRPFYFYRQKFFLDKLRFLKHLPSRWNNDEQLFYDLFLKQFPILDVALSIDENFVYHHPYFKWLPDVFQQYADLIAPIENAEQRRWIERLEDFKKNNQEKFFFLYFGTSQYRRGYDFLLNLANQTGGCFIHCGLRNETLKFDYDTDKIRFELKKKEQLFETNTFIEDSLTIEYFFKSITHMVLPYRRFFGSSGVMLQALTLGLPVLSADNGIIGRRIKNFHLGQTYAEKQAHSLSSEFNTFKQLNPQFFEKDLSHYMSFQSVGQLKNVLINSFTNSNLPVKNPF